MGSVERRTYAAGVPHIHYFVRGGKKRLEVELPYVPAPGNQRYLQYLRNPNRRATVQYLPSTKRWKLPAAQYPLLRKKLLMKHGVVLVTVLGTAVEMCTDQCANADPYHEDKCECICVGAGHGRGSSGYKAVADHLLVNVTPTCSTVRYTVSRGNERRAA
jgi:hypothetical protein